MRRLTRLLVLLLAVAVGSAALADCATADPLNAAQMACCGATDHECGPAVVDEGCCPTDTTSNPQLSSSSAPPVQSVRAVLSLVLPWAPPPPLEALSAFGAFDREILKLPERAIYLLVSTFLI